MIEMAEMVEPSNKCQTPYPSVLDFWNQVRQTGLPAKIDLEINEVVLPKK